MSGNFMLERMRVMAPARYLRRLRMEEAVAALRSGRLPVKTIARSCGFADASYFAKAFRRSFGMSPRASRMRSRSSASTMWS